MSVSQPARFVLVGAGGYAVNVALFAVLYELGVPYVVDSVVSYFVSNALMYLGNRYFTFGLGHEGFWGAYARYVVVGAVVVTLNACVLALLVERGGLHATLGQGISLLLLTPVAFILNKRWTFQLEPTRAEAAG